METLSTNDIRRFLKILETDKYKDPVYDTIKEQFNNAILVNGKDVKYDNVNDVIYFTIDDNQTIEYKHTKEDVTKIRSSVTGRTINEIVYRASLFNIDVSTTPNKNTYKKILENIVNTNGYNVDDFIIDNTYYDFDKDANIAYFKIHTNPYSPFYTYTTIDISVVNDFNSDKFCVAVLDFDPYLGLFKPVVSNTKINEVTL